MATRLSAPITSIITRLRFQSVKNAGRALAGFKVEEFPISELEALDDCPSVRVQDSKFSEDPKSRTETFSSLQVTLLVTVKKELGVPALMDAVAAVLASVETGTDGKVDLTLDNTTPNAISVNCSGTKVTSTALVALVVITTSTKPFQRGTARLTA